MDRLHYTVRPGSPADAILTNMRDKANVARQRAYAFGDRWLGEDKFNVYYNDTEVLGFVAADGMLSKTWKAIIKSSKVQWCGNTAKVGWIYPKRPPKSETGLWRSAWEGWCEMPKMTPWDSVSRELFGMSIFLYGMRIYSVTLHDVPGQPPVLSVPYVATVGRTSSFKRDESFKLCDGLVRMDQEAACAILYAPEEKETSPAEKPASGAAEDLFAAPGPQ